MDERVERRAGDAVVGERACSSLSAGELSVVVVVRRSNSVVEVAACR